MKKEYDFSKAEKGKFSRPLKDLEIPIYLDDKVKEYYLNIANKKNTDLNSIINKILANEMAIHKLMD